MFVTSNTLQLKYQLSLLTLFGRGLDGVVVEFSPPTSEAAGSNLGPSASCWKVGSDLSMPGGVQCSMHWFPAPVKLRIAT